MYGFYWPVVGGVELGVMELFRHLRKRGHDFLVVTSDLGRLPARDVHEGVEIRRLPLQTLFEKPDPLQLLQLSKQMAQLKREYAPDLVHFSFNDPLALLHLQSHSTHPCPTLVWIQNPTYPSIGPESLTHRLLTHAERTVVTCESHRLSWGRAVPSARIEVIPNAVALPPEPGEPSQPPLLLGLGRLNAVKGFDLAVEAMPAILKAHPEASLRLVGDGPERGRLEARVRQLALQEKVEFTGMVNPDKIWEHYRQSTLVLAPSRLEGMPYVLLEAGASARPVVASRVDGNAEAVLDGETGLLMAPESVQELVGHTIRLLDEPMLARRLGCQARRRIAHEFTVEGFVDAFERLYFELVA